MKITYIHDGETKTDDVLIGTPFIKKGTPYGRVSILSLETTLEDENDPEIGEYLEHLVFPRLAEGATVQRAIPE